MASKFLRQKTWWLKLRHPVTGTVIRHSLETCDPARAELLRKRVELEISLLEPRFQVVDLPPRLRSGLGLNAAPLSACDAGLSPASTPPVFRTPTAPVRTPVDDAVAAYLRFIATENAPLHVANKISMLRRFLGAERVEKLGGPVKTKRRRARDGKAHVPDPVPFFKGQFLDEILPVVVQDFLESLGVGLKTRRHYREFFHHFFEVCMKLNLYQPTNVRYPNPIGALPSYVKRNRAAIDFLKEAEVDAELALLLPEPAIRIAAALMIYAGLRRSEALWLTRDSISADLGYLSVLNRLDEEADLESSLKTGERRDLSAHEFGVVLALNACRRAHDCECKPTWVSSKPCSASVRRGSSMRLPFSASVKALNSDHALRGWKTSWRGVRHSLSTRGMSLFGHTPTSQARTIRSCAVRSSTSVSL